MAVKITRNSTNPDRPVDAPRRDDGSLYPYAMIFDGYKSVAFADTLTDLLACLVGESYYDMTPEDRLAARTEYLNSVQVWTQARINADEGWDLSALPTEEYNILMGSRDDQPDVAHWTSVVPLVLLTTGYAPYTDLPVPDTDEDGGGIIWLDPSNDDSTLRSLHMVGEIELATSLPDDEMTAGDGDLS